MKKIFLVLLVLVSFAFAAPEYIEEAIIDELTIRESITDVFGNWILNADGGFDNISVDSSLTVGQFNLEDRSSGTMSAIVENLASYTIWSHEVGEQGMFKMTPRANFLGDSLIFMSFEAGLHVDSYYSDNHWVFEIRKDVLKLQSGLVPGYLGELLVEVSLNTGAVDVETDFTAGTIQADNGWTGTWVNAESDTVHVVGGVITDVVSP